ncbi:hypothetical protein KIW84_020937 [Lathyrus oleraceus]|uniref:Uncharacterized protein n=1 Tax=Pisum sativum TaxID=3888 RepID=A0A9D4Y8R4_PEA|nr:hypothetical protein KIW84_020937 [Pisum sativum]
MRNDDDAYNFAAYACSVHFDGDIYLEHDVSDIELKVKVPRCINGMTNMEGLNDDGAKCFNDSEDEITTAIIDGFDGIDVNLPISQEGIVAGYLDESGDDEGPKFEKFRKEQLNKDYKFKWDMESNSLDDFRDAVREWYVVELTRVNSGNTVKINVERPSPSIQPRTCGLKLKLMNFNHLGTKMDKGYLERLGLRNVDGDGFFGYDIHIQKIHDEVEPKKNKANASHVQADASNVQVYEGNIQAYAINVQFDA